MTSSPGRVTRSSSLHRPQLDGRAVPWIPGPRDRAVCGREAQIQALEGTQPVRSMAPGRVEQRTHDSVRHGTTTLFAALEVATGR
jgi:hypothetical protein